MPRFAAIPRIPRVAPRWGAAIRPRLIALPALAAALSLALLLFRAGAGDPARAALLVAAVGLPAVLALLAARAQLRVSALAVQVARMLDVQDGAQHELASVVHDLKGPLSTVSSYLDLIAEGALGPVSADTRAAAQRAAAASTRARTLVESVLLQQVRAAAAQPLVRDAIDLRALIRDVTEALRAEITASHAEVTVEPLPPVLGDQAQLFRVFENLVQNAVKYARPGEAPMVTITAACANGLAEIAVRDHGIGIAAKDRERVFDPAVRAANGAAITAGHGLGLATVRRLVRDLGGEVWVDATTVEGATVRLSLPLA